jgi:hypothetical protein
LVALLLRSLYGVGSFGYEKFENGRFFYTNTHLMKAAPESIDNPKFKKKNNWNMPLISGIAFNVSRFQPPVPALDNIVSE